MVLLLQLNSQQHVPLPTILRGQQCILELSLGYLSVALDASLDLRCVDIGQA